MGAILVVHKWKHFLLYSFQVTLHIHLNLEQRYFSNTNSYVTLN